RLVFQLAVKRDSAPTDKEPRALLAVRYAASPEENGPLSRWHDTEFSRELLDVPGVLSSARYDGTEGNERLVLYELDRPWLTQDAAFGRLWTAGWETRRASLSSYRRVLHLRIL
ncbi:MAG TPA: hypothetical protein VEU07_01100, partial [Candidatus Acidoferrum sp.]|nr:hypothetical protein [Candidatus Acidoferrum sp.]